MSSVSNSAPYVPGFSHPSVYDDNANTTFWLSSDGRKPSAGAPAGLETRPSEKPHPLRISMQSDISDLSIDSSPSRSLNTGYHGPIIPPNSDRSFRRRTLVVCFDGTGDQFDLDNSNVINFFSVLKKGDRKRQLVYYQSGIGTYSIPQVATPLFTKVSKTLDLMFANNLNHHVMTGYQFLMQNYKSGDKICIFGFSRGAYTARALAGMIHKVGLLPAGNEQQVPFAYKMFKNDTEIGWEQSVAFKRTFSIDVDIDFVGVWDTVASVGLLPTTLPFTKSNTAIKVFRHALSLDEHRAKFRPSIYEHITAEEAKRGDFKVPPNRLPSVTRGRKMEKSAGRGTAGIKEIKKTESKSETTENGKVVETAATKVIRRDSSAKRRSGSGSRSRAILGSIKRQARTISDNVQEVVERVSLDRKESKSRDKNKETKDEKDAKEELSPDSERDQLEQMYLDRSRPTDVLEVWFAGCHCDVGGGSVPNSTPNSLARIPLRWMIRECFLARTGIQFEAESLKALGLVPASLYPRVMKTPHPEEIPQSIPEQQFSTLSSPPTPVTPRPAPPPELVKRLSQAEADKSASEESESTSKQEEVAVKATNTENTASDGARETERAVTVIEAEKTNIGSNTVGSPAADARDRDNLSAVAASDMDPQHSRRNNISLDATLVNFSTSSDSLDTPPPDVNIEGASVASFKIEDHHSTSVCVPQLEGYPFPTKHERDESLRPPPIPMPAVSPLKAHEEALFALEREQDQLDAKSKIYDQLKIAKWWWILEFIPFRERIQRRDGTWAKKWRMNRGRGRVVPQEEPLHVHRSVKMRMEAKDLKYKPRVKFEKDPIWVD
ncbi:hypothetical protein ACEPAG_2369 [Sanghuangporus baumii]